MSFTRPTDEVAAFRRDLDALAATARGYETEMTGVILDDNRMNMDILLNTAAKLDCEGIKNLSATSAEVRRIMMSDEFWHGLARLKEFELTPRSGETMFHVGTFDDRWWKDARIRCW